MARLLGSHQLREHFGQEPEDVARSLRVAPDQIESFVRLDYQGLCRQATALIRKRWHEVSKLVPKTVDSLDSGADQLFYFYATAYWPEGHRRHALDSLGFLQFLSKNRILSIDRCELKRVRRLAAGKL